MKNLIMLTLVFVLICGCSQNSTEDQETQSLESQDVVPEVKSISNEFTKIDPSSLAKINEPFNIKSYYLLLAENYDEALATLNRNDGMNKIDVRGGYLQTYFSGEGANSYEEFVQWNLEDGRVFIGVNKVVSDTFVEGYTDYTEDFDFFIFGGDKWLQANFGILATIHGKSGEELKSSQLFSQIFLDKEAIKDKYLNYHLRLPQKGKDIEMIIYEQEGDGTIIKKVLLKWNDGVFLISPEDKNYTQ